MARDKAPLTNNPLTLEEALRAWGDPAEVAEMTILRKEGAHEPLVHYPLGIDPVPDYVVRRDRYDELRKQLEAAFVAQLQDGSLEARGYDERAPINAERVIVPAERWHELIPNFDGSSAAGAGVTISGIRVSRVNIVRTRPGGSLSEAKLHILKATRRARFDSCDFKLTPKSFNLLAILAEAARQGVALVRHDQLENKLFEYNKNEKAVGQAIFKLRSELTKSGVRAEKASSLIENVRAQGYRLSLSASDIRIDE